MNQEISAGAFVMLSWKIQTEAPVPSPPPPPALPPIHPPWTVPVSISVRWSIAILSPFPPLEPSQHPNPESLFLYVPITRSSVPCAYDIYASCPVEVAEEGTDTCVSWYLQTYTTRRHRFFPRVTLTLRNLLASILLHPRLSILNPLSGDFASSWSHFFFLLFFESRSNLEWDSSTSLFQIKVFICVCVRVHVHLVLK